MPLRRRRRDLAIHVFSTEAVAAVQDGPTFRPQTKQFIMPLRGAITG